jgi:hypothetical protein
MTDAAKSGASSAVEVLHLDAHTGHACVFTEPTCCPYHGEALDILAALDAAGYEVVRRACTEHAEAPEDSPYNLDRYCEHGYLRPAFRTSAKGDSGAVGGAE